MEASIESNNQDNNRVMRNHGLQKPFNTMQVSTWVMFPLLLGHFVLFITLVLPPVISVPATVLFFISAFSTFYNGAICCKTDSMDEMLYRHLHPDVSEDTIKKKSLCGCAPFHIPHPLEDRMKKEKKRLKNQSPPSPQQQQQASPAEPNNNDDATAENSTSSSTTTGNLPRRKVFMTSPRDIMARTRRNKELAAEGSFYNRSTSETVATTESGASNSSSLFSFTRISRQQKETESNFQPDESNPSNDGNHAVSENAIPEESQEEENELKEKEETTKFCWVCTTQVHEHSMHCKFCDKCVSKFDHHCMWLNTCIGDRNYEYFYKTVISSFFFVLIHSMSIIIFLVGYGAGGTEGAVYKNSYDWLITRKPGALLAFNIFFLLVTLATLGLVGQLLMFHIALRKQKLTTYEFIVKSNALKRELASMEAEIHSRRIMALGKANREGKKWDKFMLTCGKYKLCESIDPIRQAILKEQEEKARSEAETAKEVELTKNGTENFNESNDFNSSSAKYPSIQEQDEDIENNFGSNAFAAQKQPERQHEPTANENTNSYTYRNNGAIAAQQEPEGKHEAATIENFDSYAYHNNGVNAALKQTTTNESTETYPYRNNNITAAQKQSERQYESTTNEGIDSYTYRQNELEFDDNPSMSSKVSLSTASSNNTGVKSHPDPPSLSGLAAFRLKNSNGMNDSRIHRLPQQQPPQHHVPINPDTVPVSRNVNEESPRETPNNPGSLSNTTASGQQRSSSSKNRVNKNWDDNSNNDDPELLQHRNESQQQQYKQQIRAEQSTLSQAENRVPSPTSQQQQRVPRDEYEVQDNFDENRVKLTSPAASLSRTYGLPKHIEFSDSDDVDASSIEASLISKMTDVRSVPPSLPPQREENDK